MDIFAMIFAICVIAAALAGTVMVSVYAGGILGGLAYAGLLIALYKAFTHQSSPDGQNHRDTLNAFQMPLADE